MRPHDLPLAPGVGAVDCTVLDGVLMAEIELTLVAVVGPKTPLKILSTRRGCLGAGGIG